MDAKVLCGWYVYTVYICIYVGRQPCKGIHVCILGHKYTYYTCMYLYMYAWIYMCVYASMYVISMMYIFRFAHRLTYLSLYMGRHNYMYIYTLHTCMHILLCMCACIQVYMYVGRHEWECICVCMSMKYKGPLTGPLTAVPTVVLPNCPWFIDNIYVYDVILWSHPGRKWCAKLHSLLLVSFIYPVKSHDHCLFWMTLVRKGQMT